MSDERYQKIKDVFYRVWSIDLEHRSEVLDHACNGDAELRREVVKLLDANQRCPGFLHQPLMDGERFRREAEESLVASAATGVELPPRIGRYRVIRLIGEGGMGTVYEAEQENPKRRVALKVIRPTLSSRSLMQRFDHEVKILGRLQHPGIAQIFEAGISETGDATSTFQQRPFFAMEYVEGAALTQFAVAQQLNLSQRLELLVKVCDAVHYGHQRGVIHRDLKPANILVTENGGPKVIDFGVARATDADPMLTLHTEAGQMLGTLAYMSPEQVSGSPDSVDVRSDVYALGVIGYELLSGRLPYDMTGKIPAEAARIIRDNEPSSLSSISRNYRGDIETIFGKAIEKDPKRRYQSAAELAADLQRYLHDEPILARPPTVRYQVGKFARRHKELVAGLVLVFLVLIGGIVGVSLALVQATAARNAAAAQAMMAERVNQMLQRLLSFAKPGMEGGGRDVKVIDMLNSFSSELATELHDFPEIEVVARKTLGKTYLKLGLYEEASASLRRAMQLIEAGAVTPLADSLEIQEQLAQSLTFDPNTRGEGTAIARKALESAKAKFGPTHPVTLKLMYTLSLPLHSEYYSIEAEPLLRELVSALEPLSLKDRPLPLSGALCRLAEFLSLRGRRAEADAVQRRAMAMELEEGSRNAEYPTAFGLALMQVDLVDCERYLREALDLQYGVLGKNHPSTLLTEIVLAEILARRGLFDQALAFLQHINQQLEATNAPPEKTWISQGRLAQVLDHLGRWNEAKEQYEKALQSVRKALHDEHMYAQFDWRRAVMCLGLRIQQPWKSEGLRSSMRQLVNDSLFFHPTKTFRLEEINWSSFHWTADQLQSTNVGDSQSRLVIVAEGSCQEAWSTPDLAPGLYRLTVNLNRAGASPVSKSDWMLVAPWSVEKFNAYKVYTRDQWQKVLSEESLEDSTVSSLAFAGWWGFGDGFGPQHADYSFGIVATTTVTLPTGKYQLLVNCDGCMRVFVDDHLVLERWTIDDVLKSESAEVEWGKAPHTLRIEYVQDGGDSRLWVRAIPVGTD